MRLQSLVVLLVLCGVAAGTAWGGTITVTDPATGTVIATLHSGDFFGEMALLDHAPRNATVRATDYCDLFVLAREAFDPILDRYPDFARHIRAIAAARNPQHPPGPILDLTPAS